MAAGVLGTFPGCRGTSPASVCSQAPRPPSTSALFWGSRFNSLPCLSQGRRKLEHTGAKPRPCAHGRIALVRRNSETGYLRGWDLCPPPSLMGALSPSTLQSKSHQSSVRPRMSPPVSTTVESEQEMAVVEMQEHSLDWFHLLRQRRLKCSLLWKTGRVYHRSNCVRQIRDVARF